MLALLLLLQGAALTPLPLPPEELRAMRLTTAPPRLDGRLDDAAWVLAPVAGSFVQQTPDPGAPASEATEFRVVYTSSDLYVGLRMHDREAHLLNNALGRRDDPLPTDWVFLIIDAKRDRRTAFHFGVSVAGVRLDRYRFNDGEDDISWDGIWDVAVSRDSAGWSAEYRIPLSQLQIDGRSEGRIGFNVGRIINRRNERSFWRPIPLGVPAYVSYAGDLAGFDGLRPRSTIGLAPYTLGGTDRSTAGLDLRAGLPGGLLLTGAINPDFGQVEADPSQVNLGASELFVSERRPFFTAGMDLFQFALAPDRGTQEGLFYTRRLGRAPQLEDGPDATRILGAAKLTGRSAGGWTTAFLGALTAEERSEGGTLAEPRTGYGFGRIGRDLREGLTTMSLVGGVVRRADDDAAVTLRRASYTGGFQLLHRFNDDANAFRLNLAGSRVEGAPEALIKTQRSSVHYFQRPDIGWGGVDSNATSLSGWSLAAHLDDHAGAWRWSMDGQSRSPGFEVNDLGFQRSDALHSWQASVTRYWGRPGRLAREASIRTGTQGELQWDGTRTNAAFFAITRLTLPNFWTTLVEVWHRTGGIQPTYLRGGPGLRLGGNNYIYTEIGTDTRGKLRGTLDGGVWHYPGEGIDGFELSPVIAWRPAGGREFSLGPRLELFHEGQQWAGRGVDGGTEEVVGTLTQRNLGMTFRGSVALTPALSFQGYAEPFLANTSWGTFRRITDPRARRSSDRGVGVPVLATDGVYSADLDGNGSYETTLDAEDGRTARLNANLVLRWEYRTGSTFFLVWQHGRESTRLGGPSGVGQGLHDLGRAAATDVLTAKLSYWFSF